jgi:methionine-S-sulfoxide reductase
VVRTRVGYAGGAKDKPTYTDLGDHTESIQIDFDPEVISYERLLQIFWSAHDPCSGGFGTQYKAILFYHNDAQKKAAEKSRDSLKGKVVTELRAAPKFWPAEDYHQKYSLRNTRALMKEFEAIYPKAVDFMNSTAAARINGYLAGEGTAEQVRAEADKLGLTDAGLKKLLEAVKGR